MLLTLMKEIEFIIINYSARLVCLWMTLRIDQKEKQLDKFHITKE